MEKTAFDKIVENRATQKYEESIIAFHGAINEFMKKYPHMNNHSFGNSLNAMIHDFGEKTFKDRKANIIEELSKKEINYIMSNLENIKFLFEQEQP